MTGPVPPLALHPAMEPFRRYHQPPAAGGALDVRFLGTTSLLFRDRETAILSDGFVTRPGLARAVLGRIAPDRARIDQTLRRLDVRSLAAVFCGHSHYDHALDAPVFAERTGAVLLGSSSTANVGRGLRLPESQIQVVAGEKALSFGGFELTFIKSRHSNPHLHRGTVDEPLVPPARQGAWKTGTTYSVLIRHGELTILLHGSAHFSPGALRGRRADVVYLGIGSLGRKSNRFVDQYWGEVVRTTGARRVVLVHWDNFFRSLDVPLAPMPWPIDRVPRAIRHILRRADADGVEVLLPVPWQPTDPFAGLP